jgi:hypothetical protein
MRPLAIDLFCGAFGWSSGLVAEGWRVVGFDINHEDYHGPVPEHCRLVLQDVLTIHGAQFASADLIVASPPCQEYSYMAMPWSIAKQKAREYRDGTRDVRQLTALFDACFRIQREASEAAGRHIPLVVENVCGAQKWVGRARWHFGSFYLWGDVPALMPIARGRKNGGGTWFNISHNATSGKHNPVNNEWSGDYRQCIHGTHWAAECRECGIWRVYPKPDEAVKVPSLTGRSRTAVGSGARFTSRGIEETGVKQGGDWFNAASLDGDGQQSISRRSGSKSSARKAASAHIAKIPLVLARHIARAWYPTD